MIYLLLLQNLPDPNHHILVQYPGTYCPLSDKYHYYPDSILWAYWEIKYKYSSLIDLYEMIFVKMKLRYIRQT